MDPSFPTDSKAGQLGLKTCVSARINLAALLQVSKLSPANGGLNGPKIPFNYRLHKQYIKHRTVQCECDTHRQLAVSSQTAHSSGSRKSQSVRLEHNTVEPVATSCTYASAINASKDIQCIRCVQT